MKIGLIRTSKKNVIDIYKKKGNGRRGRMNEERRITTTLQKSFREKKGGESRVPGPRSLCLDVEEQHIHQTWLGARLESQEQIDKRGAHYQEKERSQ